jgi:glycine betaine/proline transport system substrate-binding protein
MPTMTGKSALYACAAILGATAFMSANPAAAACGKVTIADMNWASASAVAWIDKIILTSGYGCEADIVAGDTMPTIAPMTEKSEPDIAPETWINASRQVLDKAVADGKLVYATDEIPGGAIDGLWIPKYMQEAHPDLKTVADVLKHPELFPDPEDSSKGALYNCPAGWSCQITTGSHYKAYKMKEAGFTLVDTGSGAGLDGSIAKAFERKQGWFGYYWAPTAILGKYDMVRLAPAPGVTYDEKYWDSCYSKADCTPDKPSAPAPAPIKTVVTAKFKANAGPAYDYITKRQLTIEQINKFLAWATDNQATGEATAKYFLKNSEAVWTAWVTPEVAAKVKKAL